MRTPREVGKKAARRSRESERSKTLRVLRASHTRLKGLSPGRHTGGARRSAGNEKRPSFQLNEGGTAVAIE